MEGVTRADAGWPMPRCSLPVFVAVAFATDTQEMGGFLPCEITVPRCEVAEPG